MTRPTDVAIVIAALPGAFAGRPDGWMSADSVAIRLGELGHECTAQQAAAWLGRLGRISCPPIEIRDKYGWTEYRVTVFGSTLLHNRLNLRVEVPGGR